MSPTSKKIAIVGATGIQGSSVARTFLDLGTWHVRCLTRDPTSPQASKLAALHAEVVKADLDDKESLRRAFEGVHAIFLNTDFWRPYAHARSNGLDHDTSVKQAFDIEVRHGRNAADVAASIPTLERFVYSALGPMKAASGGKYAASHHWETKASIVEYILARPGLAGKASFIYVGAYATNPFLAPKPDPRTGELVCVVPTGRDTRTPIIDTAASTGAFVRALVEDEQPGTKLLAYDECLSLQGVVDAWSAVSGEEVKLISMTMEDMARATGIPEEVLGGLAFIGEFGYCAGLENVIEPAQLKKEIPCQSFKTWLEKQDLRGLMLNAGETMTAAGAPS
ncbi:Uncharacterized protein PECH_001126 [Penicillium ucsense]|uniref:NmrA-like domain-containing protein n=1 Tax=Penicillium ucsense TaxID=2839758 RepID=A0A8J8VXX1_9EURO|nr:Uncharacterized protein PECM_000814 [Penicillium ucsense]KAF7733137.1 Uncharacterized protein PECH_001126 [Penicillium ucsense]